MLHYFKIRSVWKKEASLWAGITRSEAWGSHLQWMRNTLKEVKNNRVALTLYFLVLSSGFCQYLNCIPVVLVVYTHTNTCIGTHMPMCHCNTATKPRTSATSVLHAVLEPFSSGRTFTYFLVKRYSCRPTYITDLVQQNCFLPLSCSTVYLCCRDRLSFL